jgi:hypothetical protein
VGPGERLGVERVPGLFAVCLETFAADNDLLRYGTG